MHLPLTILGRKYKFIVGLSQLMPEGLQGNTMEDEYPTVCPRESVCVPIEQEAGLVAELVSKFWRGNFSLAPTRI